MNRLANERSAYLNHAAHQKIEWYPWSEEAFDAARREDKPVFLSTGAVWCHWCHVMAQETFEDEETARLMNRLFINVKLDRDERPEIDRRYQQAVAALGGGGGWPLSVFLTPDKRAFYGGTYFPPEDRQGRPGFKKVLRTVADYYKTKRDDALVYAQRVMDVLKTEPLSAEELNESLVTEGEEAMLGVVDLQNGGFGAAPKFPMPGALEFLIRRSPVSANPSVGKAAYRMLEAMSAGGFHDQLGGGFHRYSVDEAWIVPHFEKMADDNAGLLRNYIDAYAVFGDEQFRIVARGILGFTRSVLSDPEGGFYASQDADVTPDDEGGYFTWTDEDFRKGLDPDEYAVLSSFYLHERGSMHHDPGKQVLYVTQPLREIARQLGKTPNETEGILGRGRSKLLSMRMHRERPFIDRSLYPSLNGMLIASYFHAFLVLGDEEVKSFGMKGLDRILRNCIVDGALMHADNIPALLDDYINLIDALIAAYEATAEKRYLSQADDLMSLCIDKFIDRREGGFFDTEQEVLGARLKRMEDVPHPSANALAIMLLLKLAHMTGRDDYRTVAVQSLKIFSALAREMGVHAGAFFCALDASFRMLKLTIEAHPDSELARAGRAVAGKQYAAIVYGEDRGRVIPCARDTCLEPINEPNVLRQLQVKLPRP
ncbi:MAG TPA: thioredoxin domain-containing protein [Nitrospirota bacterium]|nr:thioredoxin domain-containing protein [Nitrospirota bacterium]